MKHSIRPSSEFVIFIHGNLTVLIKLESIKHIFYNYTTQKFSTVIPNRNNLEPHHCVLCGKTRKGLEKSMNNAHGDATDLCACAVATNCAICAEDLAQASRSTQFYQKQPYKCQTHGRYRYAV